jgi:uncharacterized protein with PQ loop repeat
MFCPRCSQEQISEEIKFCSRCGFPLGLVSEILAHGGFLPQLAETDKNKKRWTRKNGLVFALFWFMLFSFILTPMFGILDIDKMAGMCAILGTMGGLFLTVLSFAYLKNEPKIKGFYNQELPNYKANNLYTSQQAALPPQQTQPAQSYVPAANSWKAPDTGDLVQPHSVTDGTTKLLEKDK